MILAQIHHVTVKYGKSVAIQDISFSVDEGDFVGIAGPNGAGKTTLMKALLGLIPIAHGEIRLFGSREGSRAVCGAIGYVPQRSFASNPLLPATVLDVVLLGLLSKKPFPKRLGSDDRERAENLLGELGIGNLRSKNFADLSGGEHQRVVLARALIADPKLLIFDEPSTALDPRSRDEFFRLLEKLNRERGITILFVTHDTVYIEKYANKILYLDRSLIHYGDAREFFARGEYRDIEKQYHIHYFQQHE